MVWVLACVGVCVVRPFPGGRHSHAARRAGRDRGASGARARPAHARSAQAMRLTANTKRKPCNYKVRIEYVGLTIPDKTLDRLTCMIALNQDSRVKKCGQCTERIDRGV